MKVEKGTIIRLIIMVILFSVIFAVFLHFKTKPMDDQATDQEGGKKTMYLSDAKWKSVSEEPALDRLNENEAIRLKDNNRQWVEFEKGLITQAGTEIVYDLAKLDYDYFTSWVGVTDDSDSDASLQLKVYVDDVLKYESKALARAMTHQRPMEHVTIDLSGAKTLKLTTEDSNENATTVTKGYWAGAELHKTDPLESNSTEITSYEGMTLIFNDEFDGDTLDESKWHLSTVPENGSHHYANVVGKDENIWVENGNLMLQAKPYESDQYDTTSGLVMTDGLFDFRYGRIDVRAKIPSETGMWPAIWMMPTQADYGWPMAGEIDIMELISQEANKIYSTIHSGVYQTPQYYNTGSTYRIERGTFFDAYHVYSMIWEPGLIAFYVNDDLIVEITDWQNWVMEKGSDKKIERDFPAPFDKNFYLKLNLATGGSWAHGVDETTRYGDRTTMKFDYVRVYQPETPAYNYKTDEPFANGKQGAVWYTQKYNGKTWENFDRYEAETKRWGTQLTEEETEVDPLAYVTADAISAQFAADSAYSAAAIGFRAPYAGYVKVSLAEEATLDDDGDVQLRVMQGDLTTSEVELLKTDNLTAETYVEVGPDDFIRFEIAKNKSEISNFIPVVEYIDQATFEAATK